MSRHTLVSGWLAAAVGAVLALSSCGGGDSRTSPEPVAPGPSTPPGATQVTGSERIAWDQAGALGGLRFRGYLDGGAVWLDRAGCNASGECVSPLPAMSDGVHTFSIAAVLTTGLEGARSAEMTLQKISARSVVSASFVPATGSGASGTVGSLTDSTGRTLTVDLVARSLRSPVQLDATRDGRLFVSEADGRVSVIDVATGQATPQPALSPRDLARHGSTGPLGLAVHPDFSTNRFVYVSFLSDEVSGRLTLRVVRMREVADSLGEPATLFETPLARASDVPQQAPRIAFGPDRLLYVLLPQGVEFDDERVASRPHTSMTRLDADGRVSALALPSDVASHPHGFGWHPLTGALWGVVPQVEGGAAVLSLARDNVFGVLDFGAVPRLTLQASPSGDVLAVRQDAPSAWTRQFGGVVGAGNIGVVRLATPIRVNGLIDGIAGQVADVVGTADGFYVAVEGFDPPATTTGDPATVILRVTERPR